MTFSSFDHFAKGLLFLQFHKIDKLCEGDQIRKGGSASISLSLALLRQFSKFSIKTNLETLQILYDRFIAKLQPSAFFLSVN